MNLKSISLTLLLCACIFKLAAQNRLDKANYAEASKNSFYENIITSTENFTAIKTPPRKRLTMDFSNITIPSSNKEFTILTTDEPVSQGITGTCWCFSTTSFYESEISRIKRQDIQLSEIFTVYWQYVEKVREYVRTRGKSLVDEGSETNAVQEMYKKYGAVPLNIYNGLLPGQPYHNHEQMMGELNNYLANVKNSSAWNEDLVISTAKSILNNYMGVPPTTFMYNGKAITPLEFAKSLPLTMDDYITFMSLKSEPWGKGAEYKVPDNWWHSTNYTNVSITNFMEILNAALRKGYSVSLGGDVSESGIDSKLGVMMVPTYDIPSAFINDDARLVRYLNQSTTDDHAMHLIGYATNASGTWYLVKDSGAGGHNNEGHKGYWYMHEDFVKLKMMTFTVHKNAVDKKYL